MAKVATKISRSREEVYAVLADFAAYPKWFPSCESMVIQSASGNTTVADMTVNGMKRTVMSLRYECEPDVLIKFELAKPGDSIVAYVGSYRLMNADGGPGTVLVQEAEMDAGMPKFIMDRVMKKSLEDCGEALIKTLKNRPVAAPAAAPAAAADGAAAAPAAGGSSAPAPPAAKKKRPRCLLRVVKTDSGDEQIWFSGKMFQGR